MGMQKLLIADASEEFRMTLQEYLQDSYIIRACQEGNETMQVWESFRPDVVVLDLLLPGMDGVTLLQRALDSGFRAPILATTRFSSDYIMDALASLNVGYLIVKPCAVDAVAARLADLTRQKKTAAEDEVTQPDLQALVNNALWELRVPTHPRGYACLREALLREIRAPGQQVTKTLYPEVGKVCGGNADQVEHALRRLIRQTWLCRDEEVWNRYFSSVPDSTVKCPPNKVFISAIASHILEESKKNCAYLRKNG